MRAKLDVQSWLFLAAGLVAIAIVSIDVGPDIIIYNPSPSIPRGFYIHDSRAPVRGAIVTVRAVDVAPRYARLRNFTDLDDRFIKRVAAMDGDTVCADADVVTVNGEQRVRRAVQDSAGRTLPTWTGCRTLRGEVFLLGDTPDSFDGRY